MVQACLNGILRGFLNLFWTEGCGDRVGGEAALLFFFSKLGVVFLLGFSEGGVKCLWQ